VKSGCRLDDAGLPESEIPGAGRNEEKNVTIQSNLEIVVMILKNRETMGEK
jgi:hypothetical protein